MPHNTYLHNGWSKFGYNFQLQHFTCNQYGDYLTQVKTKVCKYVGKAFTNSASITGCSDDVWLTKASSSVWWSHSSEPFLVAHASYTVKVKHWHGISPKLNSFLSFYSCMFSSLQSLLNCVWGIIYEYFPRINRWSLWQNWWCPMDMPKYLK